VYNGQVSSQEKNEGQKGKGYLIPETTGHVNLKEGGPSNPLVCGTWEKGVGRGRGKGSVLFALAGGTTRSWGINPAVVG